MLPPTNPTFAAKKTAILHSLSRPPSTYTDRSPKGSVDTAIKPLVDRINALEGVVTTSSCAGRVSVFLEGEKHSAAKGGGEGEDEGARSAVPGGKGSGGRWLFVSHEAVRIPSERGNGEGSLTKLLGLFSSQREDADQELSGDVSGIRLVRFQFEPMILHIMTSSLHHAQPILAAAINAGFRESGIQSLKNLDDPNAFPMLAIRSSGLALEYLIGYMPDGVSVERDGEGVEENITMIVSEQYLGLLLRLANERFQANTKRIRRFEKDLFRREAEIVRAWEDGKSRQERKKAEGLKQQEQVRDIRREAEKHSAANIGVNKEEDNANVLGPLLISS